MRARLMVRPLSPFDLDQTRQDCAAFCFPYKNRREQMLGRLMFSAMLVGAFTAPSWADEGDVQRGTAYALAMCSSCHATGADESPSPNPAAKTFRSVKLADLPKAGSEGESLVKWFNTTHPNTSRILKDMQGDDIAALIDSLAKQ